MTNGENISGDMLAHIVGAAYLLYSLECDRHGEVPMSKIDFLAKYQDIMPDLCLLVNGSSEK